VPKKFSWKRRVPPPDATLVDAIYELEFRQAVAEGLASLERGQRVPLEEARQRIPQSAAD
jgi:hypothetical protein